MGESENSYIILLEKGVSLDAKDKIGNIALMYLAMKDQKSVTKKYAELMSDFGDIGVSLVNNEDKTALDLTVEHDNEPSVKWLLMQG